MSRRKLSKSYCKELAETISNEELYKMLVRAKDNVSNWDAPSRANIGISRGSNWNMFCKDFDANKKYAPILKYRMLEEFGEYLDEELKPNPKPKTKVKTTHFPPIFDNF